jgi:hypothetical protein
MVQAIYNMDSPHGPRFFSQTLVYKVLLATGCRRWPYADSYPPRITFRFELPEIVASLKELFPELEILRRPLIYMFSKLLISIDRTGTIGV